MNLARLRRNLASRITDRTVRILARSRIAPNVLTFANLAISLVAAYFIAHGHFATGAVLILVSGFVDLLDGALARFTNRVTKFGAVLDSTVDRVSEAATLCGLLVWYLARGAVLEIVLIFGVLIGSFLVSYVKARAEGLGLQCQVGLFTRAERVIVLSIGLFINQIVIILCILFVFVFVTVAQRLAYLRKQGNTEGD